MEEAWRPNGAEAEKKGKDVGVKLFFLFNCDLIPAEPFRHENRGFQLCFSTFENTAVFEMATPSPLSCFTCHKLQAELTNTLKRCAKCQGALYCSRKCQTDDWKNHKRNCFSQAPSAQSSAPPPPPNPERPTGRHNAGFNAINQLLGLTNDDYLHAFPEKEAFAQLIDCFRMRMEDEYIYGQNNIGIYAKESPVPVFKRFLDLAESRPGLLPPWWNAAKRRECEKMSVDRNGWSDINCAVEKNDIMEHYNNNSMPMMLRVLGEKVYGRGFM